MVTRAEVKIILFALGLILISVGSGSAFIGCGHMGGECNSDLARPVGYVSIVSAFIGFAMFIVSLAIPWKNEITFDTENDSMES